MPHVESVRDELSNHVTKCWPPDSTSVASANLIFLSTFTQACMKLDLNCLKARTSCMRRSRQGDVSFAWEKAQAGTYPRTARKTVWLEGETHLFPGASVLPCGWPRAKLEQPIAVTGAYCPRTCGIAVDHAEAWSMSQAPQKKSSRQFQARLLPIDLRLPLRRWPRDDSVGARKP